MAILEPRKIKSLKGQRKYLKQSEAISMMGNIKNDNNKPIHKIGLHTRKIYILITFTNLILVYSC